MISQSEIDEGYALALEFCGACKDYHATRPFVVASGVRRGPEGDRAVFAPLLRRLTPPKARILVAGAADAGLLAFVHDVVGDLEPHIVVADQCPTPLVVVERYAARRAITAETCVADLTSTHLGHFDIVIAHAIIRFIPVGLRLSFLTTLREMLAPSGKLILACGLGRDVRQRRMSQQDRVLGQLVLRGIALPDPPQPLLAALERELNSEYASFSDDDAAAAGLYQLAGLTVEERVDIHRTDTQPGQQRGRRYIVMSRMI